MKKFILSVGNRASSNMRRMDEFFHARDMNVIEGYIPFKLALMLLVLVAIPAFASLFQIPEVLLRHNVWTAMLAAFCWANVIPAILIAVLDIALEFTEHTRRNNGALERLYETVRYVFFIELELIRLPMQFAETLRAQRK